MANTGADRVEVLFLTKYSRSGASSRYRTFQYIPHLERAGIRCTISPLFDDEYLEHRYAHGRGRWLDVGRAVGRRLSALFTVRRFDLVVIEYELLPYAPAFFERFLNWRQVPYIVDYDDALFHKYDGHQSALVRSVLGDKIASVMRGADLVIAGNSYLAGYARKAGARKVEIVPTVIDLEKYPPREPDIAAGRPFTIGWLGSPSTSKYLELIAPALAEACANGGGRVQLIGAGSVDLPGVPVELLPWSEAAEVDLQRSFDVGIMPLPDEPWARGKCGFKLIQYMACGLPVVASPVGVNAEIVEPGVNGLLAADHPAWVQSLAWLRDHPQERRSMGAAGRRKVEARYCLQRTVCILQRLYGDRSRVRA